MLGSIFSDSYRGRVSDEVAQNLPPQLTHTIEESVAAGVVAGSAPGAPPHLLTSVLDSFEHGMSTALIAGVAVVVAGALVTVATGREATHPKS
ncbi:hypothetical protein OH799_07365 [Nocardia sp. NBC_00881]|uniref:hypothetical protein n=1 Tax=Nocardia sp. NBC_00881 TaxID=2975995 RepID=UPI0038693D7D|nr:hypothetical protein OH799_07365 [Nocardia sp. NBC_00881]